MALSERVVVVVWDGMRRCSVRPDLTPALWAFAARAARYTDASCVFPTVSYVNCTTVVTGAYPDAHGIIANAFVGPPGDRAILDCSKRENLQRLRRINGGRIVPCQTLSEAVAAAGKRAVIVVSSSEGLATLLDPEGAASVIGPEYMSSDALRAALVAQFGPLPPKAVYDNAADNWLTTVVTEYVLPELAPDVLVCWLNEPDASQHATGLGTPEAAAAIRGNDALFRRLLDALVRDGVPTTVIVASDHGHSTVTGMRVIADALTDAGFGDALARGHLLFSKHDIVIEDGPDAAALRGQVGDWLMAQPWVGAVVAWDGPLPGALTPALLYNDRRTSPLAYTPTFTYSFAWNTKPNALGVAGTEETFFYGTQADYDQLQGPVAGLSQLVATHGVLSPHDLHTTLIVGGAGIRPGVVTIPAGVVDIAPTVLALLGLPPLPDAAGRTLTEAFADGPAPADVAVRTERIAPIRGGTLHRRWVNATAYLDVRPTEGAP